MRALLLAAGFGTRLRPLTDSMPKCLVPIHSEPLLSIWLAQLRQAGMVHCLVNTHYLAGQVEAFVANSPMRDGVTLVHEPQLHGTAGTLVKNLAFFQGEDGMLIHADNYCRADLSAFVRAHRGRPMGCEMTMMTFRTENPQSCGIVAVNRHGVVTDFHEKVAQPPGNLANGAVYVLSAKLLDTFGTAFCDAKDFSTEVIPRLIGQIYTFEVSVPFLDIGTPEAYRRANEHERLHHLRLGGKIGTDSA